MLRLILLTLYIGLAESFAPATSANLFKASGTSPFTMSTTAMKAGKKSSIPNPFNALPWNVAKEQAREARRLKIESAGLHRQLGIAEDATFEEITEVTQNLIKKAEAEGDVKKKIKVEVAKDRIMQIKLNERLAGLTILTEDAKAQSRLEEAEEDDEELFPEKKQREWKAPGLFQGLIQKPDAAYRERQIKVFGFMTLVCWVLPPMAEKIIMINWLFAAGQIGRRGMGENPDADFNPYEGRKNKPHQRTAIFLSGFVWLVLKVWTGMLGNVKYAFGPRYSIVIEATLMNICLGIFTAYTQTYKAK
jgi:uncharacterized membrane-anchored protein